MLSVEEQLKIITSGTTQIVPLEELKKKLAQGRPLTIKLGVDPTSPDLHLGHAVPLRKMRQFQDLGHKVTLIIGNGTALIGDPSGRDSTRPTLTPEQVEMHATTYVNQAMKILDPDKTTIVHNGDWILSMDLSRLLALLSKFTVARILERDDFSKRYQACRPIALHEFIYPVMQAYDSVMVKADLEMGGSDQIFNLLAGRDLMEKMGLEPQVALTMPLLVGTDGTKKMSKSYGNYVGLCDEADDMYGKLMSIPDELIASYYRLCSSVSVDEADQIEQDLNSQKADPYQLKRRLAQNICDLYHGEGEGIKAQRIFDQRFKEHKVIDAPEFAAQLSDRLNDEGLIYLPLLLKDAGLAASTGDARRKIDQGGVKVNGKKLDPKTYNLSVDSLTLATLQAGKLKSVKLV